MEKMYVFQFFYEKTKTALSQDTVTKASYLA